MSFFWLAESSGTILPSVGLIGRISAKTSMDAANAAAQSAILNSCFIFSLPFRILGGLIAADLSKKLRL